MRNNYLASGDAIYDTNNYLSVFSYFLDLIWRNRTLFLKFPCNKLYC
jgi:hypothetical protein